MTCADFDGRFDAWLSGALPDDEARALEQHAAECAGCAARLDAASRIAELPREVPPPPALRATTLRAVARYRSVQRWRRMAGGVAAVAAIALLMLIARPARKSATDFPGAGTELLARARARPELAALDAAERDVEGALRAQPADTVLKESLERIRRQREALQRLVAEVRL